MTRTIKIKLNQKESGDEVEKKDGVEALLHIRQYVFASTDPAYQPSAKNCELILSRRVEPPDEKFKKEILSSNMLASAMNALEKRTDNAKYVGKGGATSQESRDCERFLLKQNCSKAIRDVLGKYSQHFSHSSIHPFIHPQELPSDHQHNMDPLELWTARNHAEDLAAVGLQPYIDCM
jgi:hypothetical protein